MSKTINLSELRRIPSSEDIEKAGKLLDASIPNLVKKHNKFFGLPNHPKGIDYIINPYMILNSGLIQVPYPEISFFDRSIPEDIKQEVVILFYNHLFNTIND